MPRRTYPRPGHSATGPAFLPGKTSCLFDPVEVAKIPRRVSKRHFAGQKYALAHESVRDDDWRRSRESLETRPPLELQTRSKR